MRHFALLLGLLLVGCEGSLGNSTSSTVDDDSNNSVNGVEQCTYECTPVDSGNCNDSDLTNNVCYQQTQVCRGNGGSSIANGPDFTFQPQPGCVVPNVLPTPEPNTGFPIQQF